MYVRSSVRVSSSGVAVLNLHSSCSERRQEPLDTVDALEGSFSLHSVEAAISVRENQLSIMGHFGEEGAGAA